MTASVDIWSCPACGHDLDDGPTRLAIWCPSCQDPGTITERQRLTLIDALVADGVAWSSTERGDWLRARFPDWKHGGDLGWLSRRQAAWLLRAAS